MACSIETTSCDDVHDALGTDGSKWDDIITTNRVEKALNLCKDQEDDIDPQYDKLCFLGVVIYGLERQCNTRWNKSCNISDKNLIRAMNISSNLMDDKGDLDEWSEPDRRHKQLQKERNFIARHIARSESPREDEQWYQLPRI